MQMDLLAQEGKRGAFTKSLQADSTSAAEAEVKKIPVKETGLKASMCSLLLRRAPAMAANRWCWMVAGDRFRGLEGIHRSGTYVSPPACHGAQCIESVMVRNAESLWPNRVTPQVLVYSAASAHPSRAKFTQPIPPGASISAPPMGDILVMRNRRTSGGSLWQVLCQPVGPHWPCSLCIALLPPMAPQLSPAEQVHTLCGRRLLPPCHAAPPCTGALRPCLCPITLMGPPPACALQLTWRSPRPPGARNWGPPASGRPLDSWSAAQRPLRWGTTAPASKLWTGPSRAPRCASPLQRPPAPHGPRQRLRRLTLTKGSPQLWSPPMRAQPAVISAAEHQHGQGQMATRCVWLS